MIERSESIPTTNIKLKDSLRIQRDDWKEVIGYIENSNVKDNPELVKALAKAKRVLDRITESLQD